MGFSGTCIGTFLSGGGWLWLKVSFGIAATFLLLIKSKLFRSLLICGPFLRKEISYASHLVAYMPLISDKPTETGEFGSIPLMVLKKGSTTLDNSTYC